MVAAIAVALVAVAAAVLGPPTVRTPDWMGGDGAAVPQPPPNVRTDAPATAQPLGSDEPVTPLDVPVPWPFLVVVALAIAAWVAFRFKDRIRPASGRFGGSRVVDAGLDESLDPELREAARRARELLLRPGAPGHDAIVLAWVELETAAAGSGVARRPAETPSEFTTRLLTRQQADRAATGRLLRLYHEARFSTQPHVSASDVTTAVEALDTIVASLSGPHRVTEDEPIEPNPETP